MFDDARSKNLIFVAHCILNQNSISDGTAVFPGSINELLQLFMDMKIGIVQMPCPEFLCLGLDRGNTEGSKAPVVEEKRGFDPLHAEQVVKDVVVVQVRDAGPQRP